MLFRATIHFDSKNYFFPLINKRGNMIYITLNLFSTMPGHDELHFFVALISIGFGL